MRGYCFIILILLSISCKSFQVLSFEQFQDFQARAVIDTTRLRWDGFFNNVRKSSLYQKTFNVKSKPIYKPELFFTNGTYYQGWPVSDTGQIVKNFLMIPHEKEDKGLLSIHGDTITVLRYEFFTTFGLWRRSENLIVPYEGKILNDTTIINWRRIPPYPALDFNWSDTIPTTLQFVPFEQKNLIDSHFVFIYNKRFSH